MSVAWGHCRCGCGASLAGMRSDAVYASEACRKRAERASSTDKARTDSERTRWEAAIDQAIRRKLIETGEVHANDVDGLPVPYQLRNLIGNRFRVFTSRRLMAKTGEYKPVSHPAAHGRSAPVYRITQKGRAELVGLGTNAKGLTGPGRGAGPESGESIVGRSAGVPAPQGPDGFAFPRFGASAPPGEATPAGQNELACSPAGEPAPIALFGDGVGKKRTRSAWTDPEAA